MTSDYDNLTRVTEERRRIFRPDWFRDLFAGRLGLGDTFWIGNFGVALIWVPATVLLIAVLVGAGLSLGAMALVQGVICLALTLYFAALTRAVWIAARRSPGARGWRWVGLAYTALNLVLAAGLTWLFLVAG